jgi:hypothetical protein
MQEEADPWGSLANIYNDYTEFRPQNAVIQYTNVNGVPTAVSPYRPSLPKYAVLAAHCYDIDPSDPTRANILRDGAWVKEQWTSLRSLLTPVYYDFDRSGRQSHRDEAEVEWMSPEECQRWVFHSNNKHRKFPTVMCYSYAIMDKLDFEHLGKVMEDGAGKDYSTEGTGSHMDAESRRVKRRRKVTDEDDVIASALREANDKTLSLNSLQFLVIHGDADTKAKAMAEIVKMSKLPVRRHSTPAVRRHSTPVSGVEESDFISDSDVDDN